MTLLPKTLQGETSLFPGTGDTSEYSGSEQEGESELLPTLDTDAGHRTRGGARRLPASREERPGMLSNIPQCMRQPRHTLPHNKEHPERQG